MNLHNSDIMKTFVSTPVLNEPLKSINFNKIAQYIQFSLLRYVRWIPGKPVEIPLSLFEVCPYQVTLAQGIWSKLNWNKLDMWYYILSSSAGCCSLLEVAPVTCLAAMKKILQHQEDLIRWPLTFSLHQRSPRVYPGAPILQVRHSTCQG